jgi:hypothetical protein
MSNHYSDFTFAGVGSAALLDEIIAVSEKLRLLHHIKDG